MFETYTQESILASVLERVGNQVSKREGTLVYDLSSAFALELAMAYANLERALRQGFAGTSAGQYLDLRAQEHGLTRKSAANARGRVKLTGAAGAVVKKGSGFATPAGIRFVTIADVVVPTGSSSVAVEVEAAAAGGLGNVPAGSITQIPVSMMGITKVTNEEPTAGGYDAESDEELLARYLVKVRQPATSGNAAHYLQWATEVSGVGAAKVKEQWQGPGTVKVIIADSERKPASAALVKQTAEYLESVRPVCVDVTVVSAEQLSIRVKAAIVSAAGYTLQDIQDRFALELKEYLRDSAFNASYISYAKIGTLLLAIPGVVDYSSLLVNGSTGNVAVAEHQVPVAGTVELEVQHGIS